MKKLLLIFFILSSFNSKGAIYQISVWNGYFQFLPSNNITIQLGNTIQWIPLDPPTMSHTITSDNIPVGAVPFNQIWQLPADTFFQYIPQVIGLYQYVCTPHILNGMIGEFTVVNGTTSQKTYVPDDNFENYLEANGMGDGIALNDSVFTSAIDTIIYLDINNLGIGDLIGIEAFSSLTTLDCQGNQLITLDLSNNLALDSLQCGGNQLTNLDVSGATSLTWLSCSSNQLTSLDLSNNIALDTLYFSDNLLTNLDVTNNIALINLQCPGNDLASLDVSNNTALKMLAVYNNQLTSLDVSQNTALTYLHFSWNQITSLDVSQNTALTFLVGSDGQLTTLDVRNGNNTNITWFKCYNNPNLNCINVDASTWSANNWTVTNGDIDQQHYFSNDCSGTTSIQQYSLKKEILKVTDLLGRETKGNKNEILFYIFDDGTVEKKIIIE